MEEILKMVKEMDPAEAVEQMGRAVKALFSALEEEALVAFLMELIGEMSRYDLNTVQA